MLVTAEVGAEELDKQFPCLSRDEFNIPTYKSMGTPNVPDGKTEQDPLNYMCGNSLGLMPKQTKSFLSAELDAWSERGVESHFRHPDEECTSWVDVDLPLCSLMAPVVGAEVDEVAVMNSLTVNLNNMLIAFYRPTAQRYKIIFEAGAFPSDCYAFMNQCRNHGIDPNVGLVMLRARPGEEYLRTEDILSAIDEHAETLALVCLPGIQYYTGQFFDIATITAHAQKIEGVKVGWDLAHAVGNVELQLHDWNVDFAVWCSYKYLNAGPGGIGGVFVHRRYETASGETTYLKRLAGWWGNNREERFEMRETFNPIQGALGFRQSNPSVLDVVSLKSSLLLFQKYGGVAALRKRSLMLTDYLLGELQKLQFYFRDEPAFRQSGKPLGFAIITPWQDPAQHGAQLSLRFYSTTIEAPMAKVFRELNCRGVIADERRPDVIRIAPAPLYNTFADVAETVAILREALETVAYT